MGIKPGKRLCFVVGPIGHDDSDDRIHADWLLEDIIQPVFEEHFAEFEVTRADKISNPGQINTQVITALLEADLVIADLTTLNPNAFYEIGIRHTIQKPIIHMHLEGQRIPFDIAPFRSIKFSRRRPTDIRAARLDLRLFVEEAINPAHIVDNPVTFSRGKVEVQQNATPSDRIILEEIESVHDRLDRMEALVHAEYFVERKDVEMDAYSIKGKNTSPDRDVQTAIRPFLRMIAGSDIRPLGRTEATVLLPKHPQNDLVMRTLEGLISEDYTITRRQL